MIIDFIKNMGKYVKDFPQLSKVIEVLNNDSLETIAVGQYKTDDPTVRYNVFSYPTEKKEADLFEAHVKEADVQILLEGHERMDLVWAEPVKVVKPYDEKTDAGFVTGKMCMSYYADEGKFCIFFPGEPHCPSMIDDSPCTVKKVVFKLLMAN